MREIVLSPGPKWKRRLRALPLWLKVAVVAEATWLSVLEWYRFPRECRDFWFVFAEEITYGYLY